MTPQLDGSTPVTIEAEYTYRNECHTNCWTFTSLTPGQARDKVLTTYVPLDGTLWRYAIWYGHEADWPTDENDAEFLSLDEIEEGDLAPTIVKVIQK